VTHIAGQPRRASIKVTEESNHSVSPLAVHLTFINHPIYHKPLSSSFKRTVLWPLSAMSSPRYLWTASMLNILNVCLISSSLSLVLEHNHTKSHEMHIIQKALTAYCTYPYTYRYTYINVDTLNYFPFPINTCPQFLKSIVASRDDRQQCFHYWYKCISMLSYVHNDLSRCVQIMMHKLSCA